MAQDIPIDIYYNKLLDWLVDRKWVKADFQKKSNEVRGMITTAIMDMPDVPEITSLIAKSYINYFHCQQIVELLKVSEASTRNIFGSYSSQRMKDWSEILRHYETDKMFLGESANLIQHNVNYEIPAQQRLITRCRSRIKDYERKEREYTNNSGIYKEKFEKVCKDMKIKGENIKEELFSLKSELPALYEEVVRAITSESFLQLVDYYEAFVSFSVDAPTKVAPLLRFVHENGNTSVYKYKTGHDLPPDTNASSNSGSGASGIVEVPAGGEESGGIDWGDGGDDGGIDWGLGDDTPAAAAAVTTTTGDADGGIDWGIEETATTADDGGIDWGIEDSTPNDDGGIDWGDVGEGGDAGVIVVEASGEEEVGESTGPPVETRESLLENTTTRNDIIDEILELEGFASQRLMEMAAPSSVATLNMFQDAPSSVQMMSKEKLATLLEAAVETENLLTSQRTQQLILIASSPRYVERLAESLKQKQKMSSRMLTKAKELREQQARTAEELEEAVPKLKSMIEVNKELQRQVEKEISKLYKNRKVNLIGEINNLSVPT